MSKRGRQATENVPKWQDRFVELAHDLALLGATDAQIAAVFGVSKRTLIDWKQARPEFAERLQAGKDEADAKVAKSLYQQALDGNVTACIFWLKNRRPVEWRDRHEVTGKDGGALVVEVVKYADSNPA